MTEGTERSRRYCRNCGAQARPGDAFCVSCGARLDEESDPRNEAISTPVVRAFAPGRGSLPGDGDFRDALRGVGTLLLVVAACFAFAYSLVLGLILTALLALALGAFGRNEGAHTVAG